jgi:stress response protein YsnF
MSGLFGFGRKEYEFNKGRAGRWPQPPTRAGRREGLALEARVEPEPLAGGWVVRLPVRAEDVSVEKRSVVFEEVVISTRPEHDVERIDAEVRREELVVDTDRDDRVHLREDRNYR